MTNQYVLSQDVYSVVNNKRLYGSKGEKVTVITRSGHVIGVQKTNGDRFYVLQDDLEGNKTELQINQIDTPKPGPQLSNPPEAPPVKNVRKKVRKPPRDSISLFESQ